VGEAAAKRCQRALQNRGVELAAAILSPGRQSQPIQCLLLDSETFRAQFGDRLPDWGIGVALSSGRVVALDVERQSQVGRSVEEVFLHELAHALVFQTTDGVWLPTWFHEGIALWKSGEWRFLDTVSVILSGGLPDLIDLSGPFPANDAWADQAYRTSLLAVETLQKEHGPEVVSRLLVASHRTGDFATAFAEVTGEQVEAFAERFAAGMKIRFGWLVWITRWPGLFTLASILFAVAALVRLIRRRRRLAEMPDEPPGPSLGSVD
jgi:hypothetical protein